MKSKIFLSVLVLALMVINAFGQKPTLELTFTAIDSAAYVQIDSIKVINRTQGGDTVLYWPDTVLVLNYQSDIAEIRNEGENLQLFQNYPNPVKDQTTITLYIPEKGKVSILISDMLGRKVINTERVLERGYHSFRFAPGGGNIFFVTAYWKATNSSIKILSSGNGSGPSNSLEYTGSWITEPQFKKIEATQNFSFSLGDTLLYTGYANRLQSGIPDIPETSGTYTFQFATNIPCPGTPTVTYEGQVYNTIQIFSQCWLKENLNVGITINGSQNQQNNGTLEKYCYDNDPANCDSSGGFYQWNEMMQYTTLQGSQGICPSSWHIPSDEEWKVLEGAIDSLYGIGDPEWDIPFDWRGFDAGERLKSENGWENNGNGTDLYGFFALPAGCRLYNGDFIFLNTRAHFWSSNVTSSGTIWARILGSNYSEVNRDSHHRENGFSVRCVRD